MHDKNKLRNQDLARYEPGDHIPASLFELQHWVGISNEFIQYSGRLQSLLGYIENYYLYEHPTPIKVLAVQKDYGVYLAVGAEASAILSQRAANTVRSLRKTSDMMSSRVDRRYMTPEEQRRHDTTKQRVQLQIEALDRAEITYTYQRQKAKQKQPQAITAD